MRERQLAEDTMAVPVIDLDVDDDDGFADDEGDGGFLDELRGGSDQGLGPVDDDTDAALGVLRPDDDDDQSWRRRFGGRR